MWQDFPLFPKNASTMAGAIDGIFLYLVILSIFFALLIAALIVVFSVRYRRRHASERGADIHGSLSLEIFWTAIPLVLALTAFGFGAVVYFDVSKPPADAMDIYVTAKQWMWKLQHPQGQREINALHVPVGRPVRLTMTSEDVIHSFYVPAFRMKRDVLPGRYTETWFEATRTGEYHLFCAEYCGAKHSGMIGTVYVLEPKEYEQWLSGAQAGDTPVAAGAKLFERQRCNTCHDARSGSRGPDLAGLFGSEVELEGGARVAFDEAYVRESILTPMAKIARGYQPLMPTYEGQLSEEQILQLIAYLKSIAGGANAPGANAANAGGEDGAK